MDKPQKTWDKRIILSLFIGALAGFLQGALAGIVDGIAGIIIGALLGALLGLLLYQVISRRRFGRKLARYFEVPGKVDFDEGPAGLSAYCALGTLLVSLSVRVAGPNPLFPHKPAEESDVQGNGTPPDKNQNEKLILRRVIHGALKVFPGSSSALALMERFCKTALSMTDRLNPDLLAESLAARRSAAGDLEQLGQELESLAKGDRALREAASIRQILAPFYNSGKNSNAQGGVPESSITDDPWLILGLKEGAAAGKIKSRFRKLAALYHPEVLQSLDEAHQQSGAQTFVLIQEAYRKLMEG
jgi:DnaJ like chaperone protein